MNRILAGSVLLILVVFWASGAKALDKEALKKAKALAACRAQYESQLGPCRRLDVAVACYAQADLEDLDCRHAAGAAGHSDAAADLSIARCPSRGARPLACVGSDIFTVCANGHARAPRCHLSGQEAIQEGQGILVDQPVALVDPDGDADRCSNGTALVCSNGFAILARPGQDLCWDSFANSVTFDY
jgi:hypothetical protein